MTSKCYSCGRYGQYPFRGICPACEEAEEILCDYVDYGDFDEDEP